VTPQLPFDAVAAETLGSFDAGRFAVVSGVLDPSDRSQVAAALLVALEKVDANARLVGSPERVTAATSTSVWFVELTGGLPEPWRGRQVLRIFGPDEEDVMDREVVLGAHLSASSYPVARTHWHGLLAGTHPAALQERLAGRPAIELLATTKARRVVRGLGSLQADLHAIDPDHVPLPRLDGRGYLEHDLARRRAAIVVEDPTDTWEWLSRTADRFTSVENDPPVLCHGDFHPLNALVDDNGHIGIVDWTDACICDRHHDVGRSIAIFWFASLIAERTIERVGLRMLRDWLGRTHRAAYERRWGSELSDDRLAWWQVVHLFRGWLQLGELAEGTVADRQSSTTERLPSDLRERLLDRCLVLRSHAAP
jgi:aminoglycoside phosphotransferase (APT) family kinase protein